MADPSYPAPPWRLVGSMWVTLFRLAHALDERRPSGTYAAAFVSYDEGSPLTYRELLVARPVADGRRGRAVSVTDIWVDSPESRTGGRELWAIPKELCDFSLDTAHTGPVSRTEWTASLARRPIASARFRDVSRAAPELPLRGRTWQPGTDETAEQPRTARITGSAKTLPARAHWDIDPAGPLGWLDDARQLASFRLASFRLTFG